jgi:phytoene synthase
MSELEKSYLESKNITRKFAKSFYLGSYFLDTEKRKISYVIYAFCRLTDDLVDENPEESVEVKQEKLRKLKLFLENKESLITDFSSIKLALVEVLQSYPQVIPYLLDLIVGVETDLFKNRFENRLELDKYCYGVAGAVGLVMTEIIGYKDKKALDLADEMGKILQIINILRDVGEDLAGRNRLYLPKSDLDKYQVEIIDLKNKKITDNYKKLLIDYIAETRNRFLTAENGFDYLHKKNSLGLKLACNIYLEILIEIEKNNYDNLNKRAKVSFFKKLIIIGKTFLHSFG